MRRSLLLGLLVWCSLLAGCGGEEGPGATAPDVVVVGGSQWYGHIPVWVGIEKGIFARHGFSVELRRIDQSTARLEAVAGGGIHFASIGEIAMIGAMAYGNRDFYWVGSQDTATGFEGLVGGPGVASFADLKGKTIGYPFASSVDLTCRLLLAEHGLVPGKDVRLRNLAVVDVPGALMSGAVDAALIWEPGFSKLLEIKDTTVLGMDTDTEVYRRFGTMTGPDVLVVSRSWADEDPERARRFLAAYFLSLEWVKQHGDATVDLVAGRYIDQDEATVAKNLAKFTWQGLAKQRAIMSDDGIYGQARYVAKMLHEDLGTIPEIPAVEAWAGLHLLPEDGTR